MSSEEFDAIVKEINEGKAEALDKFSRWEMFAALRHIDKSCPLRAQVLAIVDTCRDSL